MAVMSAPLSYKGLYPLTEQVATGWGNLQKVVYTAFSTADLYAWKDHLGSYTEAPHRYAELVLSIIRTHNPNWADLQAMLDIFLMAEERPLMVATGKNRIPSLIWILNCLYKTTKVTTMRN